MYVFHSNEGTSFAGEKAAGQKKTKTKKTRETLPPLLAGDQQDRYLKDQHENSPASPAHNFWEWKHKTHT